MVIKDCGAAYSNQKRSRRRGLKEFHVLAAAMFLLLAALVMSGMKNTAPVSEVRNWWL